MRGVYIPQELEGYRPFCIGFRLRRHTLLATELSRKKREENMLQATSDRDTLVIS
jgi:hypothetical protein